MTRDIVAIFSCSLYTNNDLANGTIPSGKSVGDFKEYHVVSGSTFTEEYNETLHSAAILLDHISLQDRLRLRPKLRYEFVKVFDKHPLDPNNPFEEYYIVDNYLERETNIHDHIFSYTIQLVSETKILEKIQCPNLAITHKVNKDGSTTKKPIYQYIEQYMELFIPKFKFTSDGETWDYEPLIKMPTGAALEAFEQRFAQNCADMPLTAPTMRQLLTMLMQQVGCIPTVNNRVLGFLDFQVEDMDNVQFGGEDGYDVNNTVNYIQKSCSIDSAANNLIKMSSNVLDSSNKVIVETLGFRDSGNAFLKQTQNLKLETTFPIYKIEKIKMKTIVQADRLTITSGLDGVHTHNINFWQVQGLTSDGMISFSVGYNVYSATIETDGNGKKYAKVILQSYFPSSPQGIGIYPLSPNEKPILNFKHCRCYFYKSGSPDENYTIGDDFDLELPETIGESISTQTIEIYPNVDIDFNGFQFVGVVALNCRTKATSQPETYTNYENVYHFFEIGNTKILDNALFLTELDITPLVVENSIRGMLNANFIDMGSVTTISGYTDYEDVYHRGLSDFRYGTFGYSIGSKQISGFSEQYAVGGRTMFGWLNQNYTYIENIFNFFMTKTKNYVVGGLTTNYYGNICVAIEEYFNSFLRDPNFKLTQDLLSITLNAAIKLTNASYSNFFGREPVAITTHYMQLASLGYLNLNEVEPGNDENGIIPTSDVITKISNIFTSNVNFGFVFFDIEYQPLNSFNLSYTTNEDVPFAIEQYDGSADAISDFDRLSISTQEKVDRIGNETLSINQRTENPSDIQPVPCYYQDDFDRDGMIDEDDLEPIKYVVFRKQYSINNYHFDVNYTGSKDAILKNYFTSIRTKYRAYQYVDYNSSVLRKERDTIYVCISENGYFNGDDKTVFGLTEYYNCRNLNNFIIGCIGEDSNYLSYKPIVASVEWCENDKGENQYVKNDISIIATKDMMGIVYEDRDNVGAGPYISISQMARGGWYGGILQAYQIWNEEKFNHKHQIFYINDLNYEKFFDALPINTITFSEYVDSIDKILKSPIVDDDIANFDLSDPTRNNVSFQIVTNRANSFDRVFYKDYAELINHTVQFTYYTDSKNIKWTEEFIRRNGFMLDRKKEQEDGIEFYLVHITKKQYENLEDQEYTDEQYAEKWGNYISGHELYLGDFFSIGYAESYHPYIKVDWQRPNGYDQYDAPTYDGDLDGKLYLKMVSYNPLTQKYKDIIAVHRESALHLQQKFYVSLNDTRSDKVWAEKDGVIYTLGTIGYNNYSRSLVTSGINKYLYIETHQASITVSRISSNVPDATIGELSNGDIVYAGDVIGFSDPTVSAYYQNYVLRVNGTEINANQRYIVAAGDDEVSVMIAASDLITSLSNPPQLSTKYTHDYSTNEVTITVSCNEPELNDNATVTFRYFLNETLTYGGSITNHSSATISLGTYSSATTINITGAYFRFEFPSSYGVGRFVDSDYVDKTYNISTRNLINPSITINGYESPRVNVSFTNNNSFSVVCHYSSSSGLDGGSQTIPAHSSITKQMRHRPTQTSMTISAYFVVEGSSSIQISETVSATWDILNV